MRKVHLVVCDLFLPGDIAPGICADLRLPALEKMLARGASTTSARTDASGVPLENYLSELFGMPGAPIAPVSAAFDGLGGGCAWLRADPVHLRLQRDQLVLLPDVEVEASDAVRLCSALNEHFAGQGMEFFAPHPQRWYVRLEQLPDIETVPLSQAAGSNVRGLLPRGKDAVHWHRVINEIQMLLFAHPVNESREARGKLAINSLWLWGGGCDTLLMKPLAIRLSEPTTLAKSLVMAEPADCGSGRQAALPAPEGSASPCQGGGCGVNMPPQQNYDQVCSDEVLAEMLSAAAGIPFSSWPEQWNGSLTLALSQRERGFSSEGRQLLVWTGLRSALRRGDLDAWRTALQGFETDYAQPLWNALRAGKIAQLQVSIPGGGRVMSRLLTRGDAWVFWRNVKPFAQYSMV